MFEWQDRTHRTALLAVLGGALGACFGNACSSDRHDDGCEQPEDLSFAVGGTSPVIGTGGGDSGPDLSHAVETCAAASENGDPMIDDFDDGDGGLEGDGRLGGWYDYDDESGGSQTPVGDDLLPESGGVDAEGYALHVEGGGYGTWGSGYGMVFVADCAYDGSLYDGITFWARGTVEADPDASGDPPSGDREVIKVLLTETNVVPLEIGGECDEKQGECWDSHKVRISVGPCWRRYVLPFSEFEQDGWGLDTGELDLDRLFNLSFEIAQNHVYDYWLDEVAFYRGEPPDEVEDCALGDLGLGAAGAGGAAQQ